MSTAQPTFDDIWRLFQETDRMIKDLSASQKETDKKFQETDRLIKDLFSSQKDTDRLIKELSRETDLKIEKVTTSVGKLGNRLGEFIEDAVRPAAVRLFRERGIDVHEVHENVSAQRGNEGIEVDLLVVNDTDIVAIECKSNLSLDDVKEHLERLDKLKRLLPTYANKRVMGAVAAMVIPDNVAKYAYRQGFYVIGQSGDHLLIRNDEQFTPKVW